MRRARWKRKNVRRVGLRRRRPPAAGGGWLAVPRGSQGRKRAALGETFGPGRSGIHSAPIFAAAGRWLMGLLQRADEGIGPYEHTGSAQRSGTRGKRSWPNAFLHPDFRRYPRRGNPPSSLYRTPPRPSGSHRKSAGTISRRPSYLSKLARTCKFALNIFSFPPGAAQKVNCPAGAREAPLEGFLFDVSMRGPRRAPRGGERRSKGAGAVFAAGGNGA